MTNLEGVVKPDNIAQPTPATLKKYGLSLEDWTALGAAQNWTCPCGRVPGTGRFNIDHEHFRGWKDLKPTERRRYVRGLVCWTCNKYQLARGATPLRLLALSKYLARYELLRAEAEKED